MSEADEYRRDRAVDDDLRELHRDGGTIGADLVADGGKWRRVRGPRPWQPEAPGAVLVGRLLARSTRPGDNGSTYGVATIEGPDGPVTVSGVVITGLLEAAGPDARHHRLRVVYKGWKTSAMGREFRDFELFVEVL